MSEINKVKGFNHVKNIHRNYTYFFCAIISINFSYLVTNPDYQQSCYYE